MEKQNFILNFLKIIFWIIFVAIMITTVVLIFTFVIKLFTFNNDIIDRVKISMPNFKSTFLQLKGIGKSAFYIIMLLSIVFCVLEAYLVSIIIKILKKINFNHPFSYEISNLIEKVSRLSLILGALALVIGLVSDFILKKSSVRLELGGSDFNFMIFAGIIYIIGIVYKKGVDLQSENELTI